MKELLELMEIFVHTYLDHYPAVILTNQRQKRPQVKPAAHSPSSSEISVFFEVQVKTVTKASDAPNL